MVPALIYHYMMPTQKERNATICREPTTNKLKFCHIYFASTNSGLLGNSFCEYSKKAKLSIYLVPTPKGQKYINFNVLTSKLLICMCHI